AASGCATGGACRHPGTGLCGSFGLHCPGAGPLGPGRVGRVVPAPFQIEPGRTVRRMVVERFPEPIDRPLPPPRAIVLQTLLERRADHAPSLGTRGEAPTSPAVVTGRRRSDTSGADGRMGVVGGD